MQNASAARSVVLIALLRADGTPSLALAEIEAALTLTAETALLRVFPGNSTALAERGADAARLYEAVGLCAMAARRHARSSYSEGERVEINVFDGTASRAGRTVCLADGEFAIAAAIALHPQGLSREEWCDVLWPERDLQSAARLLKVYVHRIRSKFGTSRVIDTHGNGYRLGAEVRVDVHSLEALTRRWNGDSEPIEPSQLLDMQHAFEGFRARRYRRLERLANFEELERRLISTGAELARLLVHNAFARNDGIGALTIAEQLMSIDPYDDVSAELLIRAQLRLGRPDAANRHFRNFCQTLREELDLPPPPHLARLLHA